MLRLERLRSRLEHPALALLVPLALAAAAYARVLDGQFQFDDGHGIEHNLAVKDVGRFVADHLVPGFLGAGRPVTDLTFALNYAVGGLVPWNFHLTNVAVHLAVVVLVWALGREVLRLAGAPRREWLAVAVAGIFAVHPLQSEAVSYVSQRAEALSSGLYVATLLLLLGAERRGLRWRSTPLVLAALATFVIALGAKAVAVTAPAAWALIVTVVPSPEARSALAPWRRRAAALAPFAAVAGLYAARTLLVLRNGTDAGFAVPGASPGGYLFTQLRALATYLRLLAWPAGQKADWDFPRSASLAEPAVLASGLLLLCLGAGAATLAWRARARPGEDAGAARAAAFGVLWFLLVLAPTSTVVPVADALVEHRVYLAAWGVLLAAAAGAERGLSRVAGPRRTAAIGAVALAAVWAASGLALHRRNAVWETRRALWADCVEKAPRNARAHLSLGYAALMENALEEAARATETALALGRGNLVIEAQGYRNLGAAYLALGRTADAEEMLRRAVRDGHRDPDILNNLAFAMMSRGGLDEAERMARVAAELAPERAHPWNTLGEIALRRGNAPAALPLFDRSLQADPDLAVARFNRGLTLVTLGRVAEGCREWAAVDPGAHPDVRASLERAMVRIGCPRR